MPLNQDNSGGRSIDGVVLVFLLGLFLFLSPFTFWWASVSNTWYLPYFLWLGFVALIARIAHRRRHDV